MSRYFSLVFGRAWTAGAPVSFMKLIAMKLRRVIFLTITLILLSVVATTLHQTFAYEGRELHPDNSLTNVRDFAPATSAGGISYAVDGGKLYSGGSDGWKRLQMPRGVIVGTVSYDKSDIKAGGLAALPGDCPDGMQRKS